MLCNGEKEWVQNFDSETSWENQEGNNTQMNPREIGFEDGRLWVVINFVSNGEVWYFLFWNF
jgi:hypothetical protein